MRIKLHDNYQNAGGVRLKPGEYDATDERLQGLAMYLLSTDHASIVPEPVELSVTGNDGVVTTINLGSETGDAGKESDEDADGDRDEEDASRDDADYQAMTKGQLLNIATAGGLELSERLSKQAIIDALIAQSKK